MKWLCKLGWHLWDEHNTLMMSAHPVTGLFHTHPGPDERECERCGKRQRYSPGFHHPPHWKDKP